MGRHKLTAAEAKKGTNAAQAPAIRRKVEATKRATRTAKQNAFLGAFADLGQITNAAEATKIVPQLHYDWLKADPTYPDRFEAAKEKFADSLEREATRRAREGLITLKFHQGEAIIDPRTGEPYIEYQYSDPLMQTMLKAHRPDKFAERQKVSHELANRDIMSIPVGPGEPAEAFHALMMTLRRIGVDKIDPLKSDPKAVAQRIAALKAAKGRPDQMAEESHG